MAGVGVVITEGGPAGSAIERQLQEIRLVTARVLARVVRSSASVDDVVVVTDRGLEGWGLGITVRTAGDPFHLGNAVASLVREFGWDVVLVLGGASAPLLRAQDVDGMVCRARADAPAVVVNNPLSADTVCACPATGLVGMGLPASDNLVGFLLQEAGWNRIVYDDDDGRLSMDIDTPTDLLVLELRGDLAPELREAIGRLSWDRTMRDRVVRAMSRPWSELAIVGRVGPRAISYVNRTVKWRTRVFSEERGLKALGREDGRARSVLARYAVDCGYERLFEALADCCDACLFDTRVLLAHGRVPPTAADRYCSDLGRLEEIGDRDCREFTRAALTAPMPVLLGGHTLVAGGLMTIAGIVSATCDLGDICRS